MRETPYNNNTLKKWRRDARKKQSEVAKGIGKHRVTILRAENGHNASMALLNLLANYYNRPLTELFSK